MSLSIDDLVNVQVLVSPVGPTTRGFGKGLFLGRSTVLPLEGRVKLYTALVGGVDVDFGSTTEEYKAAQVYFGQSPKPSGPFKIGRQFLAAQAGKLLGGSASANFNDYTGITNGGFDIVINGVNRQIFALDFSAAGSMAAIATIIQTKLAAALASTTCTWTGTGFLITSPTTGPASLVGYAAPPTGGSSPTDQSSFLFLTSSSGARAVAGIAIESMTAALTATAAYDGDWYGLAIPTQATVQDNKDAMAWAQAASVKFWCTISDVTCMDPANTTNLMYFAKLNGYKYAFVQYSTAPYAAISAEAREHVVDFSQPNSTSTLMFKQLPGIPAEPLTEAQLAAIKGNNGNVYTTFGAGSSGFNMEYGGVMANGQFSDEVVGLDAFSAEWQNRVFTALATAPTKVPQTDKGVQQLVDAGEGACKQFVLNGFFAPGIWTGLPVGLKNTGDLLPKGFYQYAQPVADQSTADRAARKAPPITVIATGAGAIHSVAMTFVFQR